MKNYTIEDFDNHELRIHIERSYHYDELIRIVKEHGSDTLLEDIERKQSLIRVNNHNKYVAAVEATELRTERAKKNIKLAFENLVRNEIKITQKRIAEVSKCSVNTCRKYDYIWKHDKEEMLECIQDIKKKDAGRERK